MRKSFLGGCLAAFVVLAGLIQIVPYGHDHTNPTVRQEPAWDSPATRAMTVRAWLRLPQQPDNLALARSCCARILAAPARRGHRAPAAQFLRVGSTAAWYPAPVYRPAHTERLDAALVLHPHAFASQAL